MVVAPLKVIVADTFRHDVRLCVIETTLRLAQAARGDGLASIAFHQRHRLSCAA
jgi:hypothetical protein